MDGPEAELSLAERMQPAIVPWKHYGFPHASARLITKIFCNERARHRNHRLERGPKIETRALRQESVFKEIPNA